jgi:hypothetical protein
MIRLVEQYPVRNGRITYLVDFRLSLVDYVKPKLPPITIFVECDSDQFHNPIVERSTERCQRARAIERQGTKLYRFSGTEVLKNPEICVIECARDLQRLVIDRREMTMQVFCKEGQAANLLRIYKRRSITPVIPPVPSRASPPFCAGWRFRADEPAVHKSSSRLMVSCASDERRLQPWGVDGLSTSRLARQRASI